MANIEIKVKGAETVAKALEKFWDESMKELGIGMRDVLHTVYNSAYSNIHHQTGQLGRSLLIEMKRRRVWVEGRISANTRYAVYVELGTSKMAPRRFLWRAIKDNETYIVEKLGSHIEKALLKARYQKVGMREMGF